MKKAVWSGILAAAALMVFAGSASAQGTDNKSINVSVTVNARAKLTLGTASISWVDADPDVTPTLTSGAVTVDVKARTSATGTVTLTVLAGGPFTNGAGSTIDLSTLTWSASGTSFVAGASSSATAQSVGSWVGSGNRAAPTPTRCPTAGITPWARIRWR